MLLEAGTPIDAYTIVRRLGRGTMGVVYQASHPEYRQVALKVMLPETAGDDPSRVRFLREAETLIALRHRNIVTTLDCGIHDDAPYVVMELLSGGTLRERLRAG